MAFLASTLAPRGAATNNCSACCACARAVSCALAPPVLRLISRWNSKSCSHSFSSTPVCCANFKTTSAIGSKFISILKFRRFNQVFLIGGDLQNCTAVTYLTQTMFLRCSRAKNVTRLPVNLSK
eukprot:TRINITY_DN113612_c0_g1_i1.p2 TRINITY_DN113612_c0_g1~~TRINITY_DN113612_c0_g1_i1.p2  ORF type:complete len:124 (+),score=2.63 TRINITY_DN113612_c0_g1_i1:8-379(+)